VDHETEGVVMAQSQTRVCSIARDKTVSRDNSWAVLLAGGDGARLQSLTQKIAGDCRPKQFCQIYDGKSLLTQTRERIATLFNCRRTLCVVTRAHENYYREGHRDADNSEILIQPQNRGTAVAIGTALIRIAGVEPDALITFFPCGHFYADNEALVETIRSAEAFARTHPKSLVLVGAEAHYPETEYGWIEHGMPLLGERTLLSVLRFWEKPDVSTARELLSRGCLWNTFVVIGYADTFLEMMRSRIPDVLATISAGVAGNDLNSAYAEVRSVDFSHEVLTALPHRLLVVKGGVSGWTDFGTPARVIDTLVRNGIQATWLGNATGRGAAARQGASVSGSGNNIESP
jgi:mannose-1-phosphate guanylyltransferase